MLKEVVGLICFYFIWLIDATANFSLRDEFGSSTCLLRSGGHVQIKCSGTKVVKLQIPDDLTHSVANSYAYKCNISDELFGLPSPLLPRGFAIGESCPSLQFKSPRLNIRQQVCSTNSPSQVSSASICEAFNSAPELAWSLSERGHQCPPNSSHRFQKYFSGKQVTVGYDWIIMVDNLRMQVQTLIDENCVTIMLGGSKTYDLHKIESDGVVQIECNEDRLIVRFLLASRKLPMTPAMCPAEGGAMRCPVPAWLGVNLTIHAHKEQMTTDKAINEIMYKCFVNLVSCYPREQINLYGQIMCKEHGKWSKAHFKNNRAITSAGVGSGAPSTEASKGNGDSQLIYYLIGAIGFLLVLTILWYLSLIWYQTYKRNKDMKMMLDEAKTKKSHGEQISQSDTMYGVPSLATNLSMSINDVPKDPASRSTSRTVESL